jgi:hypothetical protein
VAAVARELGVGRRTVMRAVEHYGRPLVDDPDRLAEVTSLGVDEHVVMHAGRSRRTRFATGIDLTRADRPGWSSTRSARRVARNNLAHGTRGYDSAMLDETVTLLELVVRAHALRLLGCPDVVVRRVLEGPVS